MTIQQDKWLFTPGPLTTSETVKASQCRDLGSRDALFIETVTDIRTRLLALAGQAADDDYTAVLMQGSGTFGIESVVSSTLSDTDKLLIVINGAYGRRIEQMAKVLKIQHDTLVFPENETPDVQAIDDYLGANTDVSMVAVVHCETTTGILNPLTSIAEVVNKHQRQLFVDAMSSFGAIPVNVAELGITYLVSSANKCIEGVPGFSFCIANIAALEGTKGYARSLSLDLYAQWHGLEKNGQFRFTPPVQSMLAFHQALLELEDEGGVAGRAKRYKENHQCLLDGMVAMGFRPYLDAERQSYIITTFYYPEHEDFNFDRFYNNLSDKGYVIYPGKLTDADCFRLGNIGRLNTEHITGLLDAIRQTIDEMSVTL